ncbi:DUF4260 family protein [Blastococcus sp. SYSU DS0973]
MTASGHVRRRAIAADRAAYLFLGLAVAGSVVAVDGFSWQLWVFALAPDLPLLAGGGRGLRPGQLHPRAVLAYNATHHLAGPLALTALGGLWLGTTGESGALVAGAAWLAHVAFDRAAGYGLRSGSGFQRS